VLWVPVYVAMVSVKFCAVWDLGILWLVTYCQSDY